MKQFLILIAFAIININAKAQSNISEGSVKSLKVTNAKGQLMITWELVNGDKLASFEIQASADGGLTFRSIGYVWGADPKGELPNYAYKENNAKPYAEKYQFRILQQLSATTAIASEAVGITK